MGPLIFFKNWINWTTSFVGIILVSIAKKPLCRLFWTLVTLGGIAAFTVQSVFLIQGYLQYGKTTNMQILILAPANFPAVTVCSLNPYQYSKSNYSTSLANLMEAYKFVVNSRIADLSNNKTMAEIVNKEGAQDVVSQQEFEGQLKRRKRQAVSTPNQYNTSLSSSVTNATTSKITLHCPAGGVIDCVYTFNTTVTDEIMKINDAAWLFCYSPMYCDATNKAICSKYSNAYGVMQDVDTCMSGISEPGLVYPPAYGDANPAAGMVMQIPNLCGNFTNKKCDYGNYAKPTNIYNGTYTYQHCTTTANSTETINLSIERCDEKTMLDVTATYALNSCPNYLNDMVTSLTTAMADYDCGASCKYTNPNILDGTACGNSAYFSTLTALTVCNETSSTHFSITTEMLTTTEPLTTTTEPLTTTTEPLTTSTELLTSTTELLTSTLEPTSSSTLEPTTTLESTSSSSSSTSTSSSSSSTSTSTQSTTDSSTVSSTPSTVTTTSTPLISSSTSTLDTTTVPSTQSTVSSTLSSSTPVTTTIVSSTLSSSTPQTSSSSSTFTSTLDTTTQSTTQSTTMSSTDTSTTPLLTSTPLLTTSIPISSSTKLTTTIPESSSTIKLTSSSSVLITTTEHQLTSTEEESSSTLQSVISNMPTSLNLQTDSSWSSTQTIQQTSQSSTNMHSNTTVSLTTIESTEPSTEESSSLSSLSQSSSQPTTMSRSSLAGSTLSIMLSSQPTSSSSLMTTNSSSSLMTTSSSLSLSTSSQAFPNTSLSSSSISTTMSSEIPTNSLSSSNSKKVTTHLNTPSTSHKQSSTSIKVTTPKANITTSRKSTQKSTPKLTTFKKTSQPSSTKINQKTTSSVTSKTPTQSTSSAQKLTSKTLQKVTSGTTVGMNLTTSTQNLLPTTTIDNAIKVKEVAAEYNLSSNDSQPTTIAKVRVALEIVGAGLTTEQRDQMCYSLPQIVTTCMINQQPCDMDNDFNQVFDVDFGYCYTFNYKEPVGTYITSRTGSPDGLRMILYNNVSDYLPSTDYMGFKVVVHPQDYEPFPNTEGLFSAVGTSTKISASLDLYTRLGQPYGYCDSLDSLQDRDQPFYFNGSYSTEGCFRSCFQKKMIEACSCADARFPSPDAVVFCNPSNTTQFACYNDYIETNGDYYFVNCTCYYPCNDTVYSTVVSNGKWPAGTYFQELYCPQAEQLGISCREFYSENAAEVNIYYDSLVYTSLDESPSVAILDLFNNMAGNTGLWIGFTAITCGEIVLILIQALLWLFCCPKELPEVPSCRRTNYPKRFDGFHFSDDEESDRAEESGHSGKIDPNALGFGASSAKIMANSLATDGPSGTRRATIPAYAIQYERVARLSDDYVPPAVVHSDNNSTRSVFF